MNVSTLFRKVPTLLRLRSVSYATEARTIVDTVDLDIEPSSVTVLLGPPGAGTSTLLRLIAGVLTPTRGSIACDEEAGVARLGLTPSRHATPVCAAPYVVLDPPRANASPLDFTSRRATACRILRACEMLAQRGSGAIAALREIDLAAAFADRVILMHRGQIVADGLPEIVLEPAFVGSVFARPRRSLRLALGS